MTVRELIDILSAMPEDAKAVFCVSLISSDYHDIVRAENEEQRGMVILHDVYD